MGIFSALLAMQVMILLGCVFLHYEMAVIAFEVAWLPGFILSFKLQDLCVALQYSPVK